MTIVLAAVAIKLLVKLAVMVLPALFVALAVLGGWVLRRKMR